MISPLLANIYLHVLDTEFAARGVGELVRYADDGVALCRTKAQAQAALGAVREILASLGLELHPGKTKVVDLKQAGKDWTSSAAISAPACRGGCGNRSGSSATTCTAGPHSRR